jgi:hypothetical protein
MGIPRQPCRPVEERQRNLPIGPLLLENLEDKVLVHLFSKLMERMVETGVVADTGGLENSQDFTGVDLAGTFRSAVMAKSQRPKHVPT